MCVPAGDLQLLQLMLCTGVEWASLDPRTCLAMLAFLIRLLQVPPPPHPQQPTEIAHTDFDVVRAPNERIVA